jgi:hypothetical protein
MHGREIKIRRAKNAVSHIGARYRTEALDQFEGGSSRACFVFAKDDRPATAFGRRLYSVCVDLLCSLLI